MKKPFTPPKLTPHGLVTEVTKAFGNQASRDSIIFGALVIGGIPGSQDGTVVPKI